MSKQTIAFDLDEVLSSEVDALIQYSNETLGTNLSHNDFKAPGEYWGYYEGVLHANRTVGRQIFHDFLASDHKKAQRILDHVLEILWRLKNSYDLVVVTSRRADFEQMTIEMIQASAPGIFKGVHFVNLWKSGKEEVTKAVICKEIGAGFLVDDNIEHCNLAAEAGVKALLFGEWGWNKDKPLHPEVIRIANWEEVAEFFGV